MLIKVLKKNIDFKFQIQFQMFVYDLGECHYLMYCKQKPNESILISFSKNNTLTENM